VDLRLVIVRIALRQGLHCLCVGHDAGVVIHLVIISVHHRQRVNITFFPVGLEADRSRFLDRRRTFCEILRWWRRMRIPQQAKGDTPISDAAGGICL